LAFWPVILLDPSCRAACVVVVTVCAIIDASPPIEAPSGELLLRPAHSKKVLCGVQKVRAL
jgi:hypothetical protein